MKKLLLLLPLVACLGINACRTSSVDYYRLGDEWEEASKNVKVGYTFEDFIASPGYRSSRDFWRGAALQQTDPANSHVEILLKEQRGRLYINGQIAMDFPVCTGSTGGSETPKGSFRITEKKREHRSSRYGCFVDAEDNLLQTDVTSTDTPPPGGHFKGSLMEYWMRFNGAVGLHVGNIIERDGQSHGCVRLPIEPSEILFEKLDVGSRVIVK